MLFWEHTNVFVLVIILEVIFIWIIIFLIFSLIGNIIIIEIYSKSFNSSVSKLTNWVLGVKLGQPRITESGLKFD